MRTENISANEREHVEKQQKYFYFIFIKTRGETKKYVTLKCTMMCP